VFFANKWFSRSHKTVNRLLMETLRVARLVDELGRGKNVIFRESIFAGKRPPQAMTERAGHYSRWKLVLYDGTRDDRQLRLLERLRDHYGNDEHKALIANALVLWRSQSVSTIKGYVDDESFPVFQEVLEDANGPVFFYEGADEIIPSRWINVLLRDGKDSKQLSEAEEFHLYDVLYHIHANFHQGIVTTDDVRKMARFGKTSSENALLSKLFRKWAAEGKVEKIKSGRYRFLKDNTPRKTASLWEKLKGEVVINPPRSERVVPPSGTTPQPAARPPGTT